MRYLSLFSGIEAASVAWGPLGWKPVAFAEFADFQKHVLRERFPSVPDLGDVTGITEEQVKALGPIDVVVGGSPCQDLSVAGSRAGLKNGNGDLTRSGLFDYQVKIFEWARRNNGARFMLWENVPGAFSSNGGKDFAYILGSMVQGDVPLPRDGKWRTSGVCLSEDGGRIVEWRVLDAQYFGVPQRRRRIFALLDTGAWGGRPPILLEQEGVHGGPAAGGQGEEGAAPDPKESSGGGCLFGRTGNTKANGIGVQKDKSLALDTTSGGAVCYPGEIPKAVAVEGNGSRPSHRGPGCSEDDTSYTLNTSERHAVTYEDRVVLND